MPGQINAFSLPGGRIYVTEDLLKIEGLSDDEIAFLLGHEVAHAALRHVVLGVMTLASRSS